MGREKEAYYDNLERIVTAFPGKELLTLTEVSKWVKRDPRTIRKLYGIQPGKGISVATLARKMS